MARFLLRIVLWGGLAVTLGVAVVALAIWRELNDDLPPVEDLLNYRPPTATRVYADDDTLIGEFFVERRYLVPIAQVPAQVRFAFLAAEDSEFYSHPGVNPASIVRALIANVQHKGIVQGASTITQQVVKQLLLTPERSYERKAKELILALQLESKLSKDEILYLYLNHIYFGSGSYGISAAGHALFDKDVADLTLAQAALLAGLPQAPSRYDPMRHPRSAIARQHYVLERMRAAGFITREEYAAALHEPLNFASRQTPNYGAASWYVDHVRRLLEDQYGAAFANLGLRVHTAVDLRLQNDAEEVLLQGLRDIEHRQGRHGVVRHLPEKKVDAFLARQRAGRQPDGPQQAVVTGVSSRGLSIRTPWETGIVPSEGFGEDPARLPAGSFHSGDIVSVAPVARGDDGVMRFAVDDKPQIEGALVAIEPETAKVKALVGGVDFRRSQFNRAVQAHRQPGSAFKPLVYSAAIDHGYTPASIVRDAPISLPAGPHDTWTPKNFGNKYMGPVPLRTALIHSLNTVTVRLAVDLGIDPLRDYLKIFGFPTPFPRNYSLALGSSEVTPLELTRAYGIFATLGQRFEPIFITSVSDVNGDPIEFPGTQPHFEPVMKPATAYVITDMMRSVVEQGTGAEARKLGRPAAGKTGTTNETKDAWFIGFTPDLLTGVWVGYDAERSLGSYMTGGHAATPIWTAFMKRALEDKPIRDFTVPDSISLVRVDTATGLRATSGRSSRLEVFVAGSEPKRSAPKAEPEEASPGEGGGAPATEPAPANGGAEPPAVEN